MKISRQVGTVSQILQVYVQDFNVTTGAGLANVPATNVSYSWFRSNQNGVSTGMGGSTGTLGIYSSGAWLQINSATALGWYQFGLPNDALLSGDSVGVHFYVSSGPLTFAPLPVEIELTKTNNQQYASSTVYSSTQIVSSVTNQGSSTQIAIAVWDEIATSHSASSSFADVIKRMATNVSTIGSSSQIAIAVWDEIATSHSASSSFAQVLKLGMSNVSTIGSSTQIAKAVWDEISTSHSASSSFADVLVRGMTNVSTIGSSTQIAKAVWDEIATSHSASSSFAVVLKNGMTNVSTIMSGVNVTSIVNSAAATSGAGILTVSTQAIDKGGYGVTTIASNITSNVNVVQWLSVAAVGGNGHVGIDWANVTNKAAYNDLSSTFISTNQAIAGASAPTAAQVAQAVWDEIATSHTASSSFGYITQTMAANVSTISSHTVNISSRSASSDARFAFLDISVSSRVASSDARLAFLDGSVSSRAAAGEAMALTSGERAALAGVILTTTQAESYRGVNDPGSVVQMMYEVLANITEMGNAGTTRTLNSVTSHVAGTVQYSYDSTVPSAITRIA